MDKYDHTFDNSSNLVNNYFHPKLSVSNWPLGVVVDDIVIGARGHGFGSWAGQIRDNVANNSAPL